MLFQQINYSFIFRVAFFFIRSFFCKVTRIISSFFFLSLAESGIRNYDEASIGWINFIKMRNEIKDINWNE